MAFQVTLDGKTYSTDSLTLDEAEILEGECGKTWLELNPVRTSKEFRATARVFLARDHTPADVDRIVNGFTIAMAMEAVVWVEGDDLPKVFEDGMPDPKAEGSPSTSTSSGSPTLPTDGHLTSPAGNGSVTSISSSPPTSPATATSSKTSSNKAT